MSIDVRSLQALKYSAGTDPKSAIKETAKQFEALFMQQLMKSMRDANLSGGMLDNEGSKLGTEMLDKANRSMKLIVHEPERFALDIVDISDQQRPPMIEVPAYRERLEKATEAN